MKNFFFKIAKKIYYFCTSRNFQQKKFDESIYVSGISAINSSRLRYDNFDRLHQAEVKVFSQFGEDGIIDFILYNLSIEKPTFVEIGVEDYSESNTRFLFQRTSSKGLIIDSRKDLKKIVFNILGNYSFKGQLSVVSDFIDSDNIINILKNTDNYDWFDADIFSIDIDGIDYWILEKVLPKLNSKLIIIEYNPLFGGLKEVSIPYDKKFNRTDYHQTNLCWGASLLAYYNLLEKYNYKFIGSNLNNHNGFWIHSNNLKNFKIDPIKKDDLHNFTNSYSLETFDILEKKDKLLAIKDCLLVDLVDHKIKTVGSIFNI